ncbi:glutamate 5-kinase [Lepidopterella palustris CBS 459.81]|uniref:Glutamate 5-kinase n=1 Tax=Lepidopterella palustris CBS 459.81 TaxID=1314670 RepID=A0A8E2EL24_9PEZI|nr:glutamate 5-kinase [Lepidopterella palustris CBS 459.81]
MAVHMKKHLTIVIKLGTSSIVDEKTHEPLLSILSVIVETAVNLRKDGHKVIIVSSGAIGVGLQRMDLDTRPKHLPKVQALAAIGQCRLMSLWDQLFGHLRQPVAQILLTRNDIADRTQYSNAQKTFFELLHMGVIPIVNENDTLAVTEIKFGDNDTLSAITAGMVQADYLFLMTDVDCLYDKNPRTYPDAKAIEVVEDIVDLTADVSSAGSALGTGGMSTKIVAARLATSAGVTTVITRSSKPGNIASIVKYIEAQKAARISNYNSLTSTDETGIPLAQTAALNHHSTHIAPTSLVSSTLQQETPRASQPPSRTSSPQIDPLALPPLHTRFLPNLHPIRDRYFWLLHGLAPHGTVYIDHGAWHALSDKANLLPVGVVDVEGHFAQQEAVRLVVVKRLTGHPQTPTTPPSSASISNPQPHHTNQAHNHAHAQGISTPATSTPVTYELRNPAPFEVGRALVNYSATEIRRIRGLRSTEIHDVLGYADSEYVALRENIAFFGMERSRPATPALGHREGTAEGT